jgi:hypothetical protein
LVEIEVLVKSVDGTKLAEDVTSDSAVAFMANADLVETERNPTGVTLKFVIELGTNPEVAKISVAGTADLKGDEQEIQALLAQNENDSAPPVFMKIYQKVYAILYLLSGSLDIPYPAPGLLKSVHLVSSKEMSQAVTSGAKSMA